MIPFRQTKQMFEHAEAEARRNARIRAKYESMPRSEVESFISEYKRQGIVLRLFYRIFSLPEFEEYSVSKKVLGSR